MTKVLVVGGGGREHAIVHALSKSPKVDEIYAAPGNAGIAKLAMCVNIKDTEVEKIVQFAKAEKMDLVVVGPEASLALGIIDKLREAGIKAFGPTKAAAQIESSKEFAKNLMVKYNIPTASYKSFNNYADALEYVKNHSLPTVIKYDGLAAGKGVVIATTYDEAVYALKDMLLDDHFGHGKVVIEEYLEGPEFSFMCFVNGENVYPLQLAQDHKRAYDGDEGPNTGGMGNFSPSPFYTDEVDEFCKKYIYQATVDAMKAEGREFKGIIFFGLMLTSDGPKVLEYNARFGDPEAQVVLPRMKNDIIDVIEACIDGTLDKINLEFEDNAAVCVVLASDGYPVSYEKGFEIKGLENFDGKDGYYVFHAASKMDNGKIVTNGGRVLGVTAKGATLIEARANAYEATKWIDFDNKYMRNDIGKAIEEA
jgi:phosphoribosylamine--glycine ligase